MESARKVLDFFLMNLWEPCILVCDWSVAVIQICWQDGVRVHWIKWWSL